MKAWDLQLVEVHWNDALIDPTDSREDEEDSALFGKLARAKDVGYLVRANKKEIVLAVGVTDFSRRHSNTIPMSMVTAVRFLKEDRCLTKREFIAVRSQRKTSTPGSPSSSVPTATSTMPPSTTASESA